MHSMYLHVHIICAHVFIIYIRTIYIFVVHYTYIIHMTYMLPAVGFIQLTNCVLLIFLTVNLVKSYTCSYSKCCLNNAIADCVSYASTSLRFISSIKYTSFA